MIQSREKDGPKKVDSALLAICRRGWGFFFSNGVTRQIACSRPGAIWIHAVLSWVSFFQCCPGERVERGIPESHPRGFSTTTVTGQSPGSRTICNSRMRCIFRSTGAFWSTRAATPVAGLPSSVCWKNQKSGPIYARDSPAEHSSAFSE